MKKNRPKLTRRRQTLSLTQTKMLRRVMKKREKLNKASTSITMKKNLRRMITMALTTTARIRQKKQNLKLMELNLKAAGNTTAKRARKTRKMEKRKKRAKRETPTMIKNTTKKKEKRRRKKKKWKKRPKRNMTRKTLTPPRLEQLNQQRLQLLKHTRLLTISPLMKRCLESVVGTVVQLGWSGTRPQRNYLSPKRLSLTARLKKNARAACKRSTF
jgi:hypothetical protein